MRCLTRHSWLRNWDRNREVADSIPNSVTAIFHRHNPSCRTMALGSTQPLTEMSTRNIFWKVKLAGAHGWQSYHLHLPTVLKFTNLSVLETSVPVQVWTGVYLGLYVISLQFAHLTYIMKSYKIFNFITTEKLRHFIYVQSQESAHNSTFRQFTALTVCPLHWPWAANSISATVACTCRCNKLLGSAIVKTTERRLANDLCT